MALKRKGISVIFFLTFFVFFSPYAFNHDEHLKNIIPRSFQKISNNIDPNSEIEDQDISLKFLLMDTISRKVDIEKVQNLLKQELDVHFTNQAGQTPLMIAVKNNVNLEVVKFLIEAGANVNAQDKNGKTPLMYAAENAIHLAVLFVLLEAGADKLIQDQMGKRAYDYLQNSPMMIQANANYPTACQLLEISAGFD